ncbi:MAG: DUF5658 family protein [Candidatus Thermoplasmatota archaeon]
MTQLKLSPTRRLLLWGALLAALNAMDLTFTALALNGIDGAEELNPIAAYAFEQGILTAAVLKLLAIEIVLLIALAIAPTPFARTMERVFVAWCAVFLLVNAFSAFQLLGGL